MRVLTRGVLAVASAGVILLFGVGLTTVRAAKMTYQDVKKHAGTSQLNREAKLRIVITTARLHRAIEEHVTARFVGVIAFVALVILAVMNVDSSDRLLAWSTYALVVGSSVAAWYFHHQAAEAKRLREATLRPVIILSEVERKSEPAVSVLVHLRNIGPGPALGVTILGDSCCGESVHVRRTRDSLRRADAARFGDWLDRRDISGCFDPAMGVRMHGHVSALAAGECWEERFDEDHPDGCQGTEKGHFHSYITYSDVFGNLFTDMPSSDPHGPGGWRQTSFDAS